MLADASADERGRGVANRNTTTFTPGGRTQNDGQRFEGDHRSRRAADLRRSARLRPSKCSTFQPTATIGLSRSPAVSARIRSSAHAKYLHPPCDCNDGNG
jgi:hypothetical protein